MQGVLVMDQPGRCDNRRDANRSQTGFHVTDRHLKTIYFIAAMRHNHQRIASFIRFLIISPQTLTSSRHRLR